MAQFVPSKLRPLPVNDPPSAGEFIELATQLALQNRAPSIPWPTDPIPRIPGTRRRPRIVPVQRTE
jgi:hypothetical protein